MFDGFGLAWYLRKPKPPQARPMPGLSGQAGPELLKERKVTSKNGSLAGGNRTEHVLGLPTAPYTVTAIHYMAYIRLSPYRHLYRMPPLQ